ncbi:preprotein translocase subunit SecA [Pelomyxa schiedti]|nr:preprotein translocase subunit SecA [Pelomyxa schiedti]
MHGSRWSGGVHEFVEAREGLLPQDQSYTIASISHPTFFGRYRRIFGLTGTAGEPAERNEVQEIYKVDSFDVPPNRKCMRKKLPTRIFHTSEKHREAILESISAMQSQRRSVLILFLSISESEEFSKLLHLKGITHSLLNEMQREDEDYIVFKAGQPGAVTVATNTAGRGTDIILSPEVKNNSGLHCVFTFFPQNFRVECQGLGRAGRQGEPGTCEILVSAQEPGVQNLITRANLSEISVELLYQLRSLEVQSQSASRMERSKLEQILFALLEIFFQLYASIKNRLSNDHELIRALATQREKVPFEHNRDLFLHRLHEVWAKLFTEMTEMQNEAEMSNHFLENFSSLQDLMSVSCTVACCAFQKLLKSAL